jgi:hypothetical protein
LVSKTHAFGIYKQDSYVSSLVDVIILFYVYSIAGLYNWRYKKLGNLPHAVTNPEYRLANAGFVFDYQLINVEDFNGVGESEPNPYFYQVSLLLS